MTHYFSEKQEGIFKTKKIQEIVRGQSFDFFLSSGVFSSNKIDKGSKLLAEKAIIKSQWKILDFGCGAGIIGVVIAK